MMNHLCQGLIFKDQAFRWGSMNGCLCNMFLWTKCYLGLNHAWLILLVYGDMIPHM